jgi:hypothetical protein
VGTITATFSLPNVSCNNDACTFAQDKDGLQTRSHVSRGFFGFRTIIMLCEDSSAWDIQSDKLV